MRLKYSLLVTLCLLLFGCAQFVAPTGGKKDETPPKLTQSIPENKKLNFQGREIELTFDEWINTQSLRQELLITPEMQGTYDIKPTPNGVKLVFDKPFKPNTTYTLNFRNGIKDLNESNEAKNLKLVFSTGAKIDSLSLKGEVRDLFSNQPQLETLVAIYELSDTLNFKKHKPNYFTKTDSLGIFGFENLRGATYRLLAFNDKNNNLIYDDKNENVGFLKDSLLLNKAISGIELHTYKIDIRPVKITKRTERNKDYSIIFDEGVKDYQLRFLPASDSLPNYISGDKTLKILNTKNNLDSVRVAIFVRDSVDNILADTLKFRFREPDKKKIIASSFFLNPSTNEKEEISQDFKIDFRFDIPIEKVHLDKIKLLSDSTITEKPNFTWNASKTKLTIQQKIKAQKYLLVDIPKETFFNFQGDTSKAFIEQYNIIKPENYGSIEGKIGKYEGNLILHLLTEEYKLVAEQTLKSPETKYIFRNVKEGTYFVRIIEDKNKNDRWDAGNFENRQSPERVQVYNREIPVKANFELKGVDISLK